MRPLYDYFLTAYLADISTAGQIYVPVPDGGEVVKILTALNGAIGTANAALTFKINGTAITGSAITVAYSGSAAGDVDTSEPTGANVVKEGDVLEAETDGASTNTVPIMITFCIRRTSK